MGETESAIAGGRRLFIDAQREELIASLCDVYDTHHGLAVITAPSGAGLTSLVHAFIARLGSTNDGPEVVTSIVDASATTVAGLLCDLLSAFGYELPQATHTELLSMTQLIAQHQAQAGQPPLIVFEHVDRASPQVLRVINELASLRHARRSACCIVLTGADPLNHIVNAEAMREVGKRISLQIALTPFTQKERREFLNVLLGDAGVSLPARTVGSLARLGEGWPGSIIDAVREHLAMPKKGKAIASTDSLDSLQKELKERATAQASTNNVDDTTILRAGGQPVPAAAESERIQTPSSGASLGEFLVSHNGKLVERYPVTRRKVLIGRAQHNDIVLESKWVSRYHAIIVCHRTGASLVDINSTNGMTVNSTLTRQGELMHNDIVVIGDFRIKYLNPAAERRGDDQSLSDTRVLKKIELGEYDETVPVADVPRKPKHSDNNS